MSVGAADAVVLAEQAQIQERLVRPQPVRADDFVQIARTEQLPRLPGLDRVIVFSLHARLSPPAARGRARPYRRR